ncbi:MAG TPA: DEAD/DEAH box helicase family protein [Alphaproteobacteria bacterium]|nr:DEAD/DEAH box helicase family protein [Alphaproteobacteria bacterium]
MIKLKKYQESSLEILRQYLELARFKGAKQAYDEVQYNRYGSTNFKPHQALNGLEDVPYACLRLPTGGGKTLLSAHTIRLAGESYVENDYPLTLWLVPTNIIKQQTLETLKNPDNANRRVLEDTFNGRFRVFDITDFRQIRPQDISDAACIVVSTFAALRVDNTEGRKVYDHDENLEPHFSKIPAHTDKMERDETSGKIKFSFANLLHWHRPLVIVDEAHNAKSDLSVEVLNRVNPACVIEYTATPAKNSNIIHSVSAAELKAEEMIKLPIILSDHVSWEQAITASIQTRQKLEEIALKDKDYIRPIILFQAENKGQDITVEVLEKYLVENEGIDRAQIAIATGEQRELDSINLFDPNCPIRYVITVQALKEGWDCSFAYVLCSVANTKSATSVEQLLGRVLRMPYAKTRTQDELNKAYAHVSSQSWPHAVTQLHDRLVSMGFEQQEAEEFIYAQPSLGLSDQPQKPFEVTLTSAPDLSHLDIAEKSCVQVEEKSAGIFTMTVTGNIDKQLVEKLSKAATDKKDKAEISLKGHIHIKHMAENLSPSQRGEVFSIPQLCLNFEDGPELAERELCLSDNGWAVLDYYAPLTKDHFTVDDKAKQYVADIAGQKIVIKSLNETEQLNLDGIRTDMTDQDLARWLDRKLRAIDIKQEHLLEYLRKTIRDLLARDDLDMPKLVRGKFILEKVLRERINAARMKAYEKGYQTCMFGPDAIATVEPAAFSFTFPADYPANLLYEGPIGFDKHFYPRMGIMNGEEAECAQAIDRNPLIKFWVRNLERQPQHAFWLPTSTDKFYPDFVAQLNDGRLLVIEYKGGHLAGEDTQEKELIGKVWAEKSGNLFLMAWKKDKDGRDVYQQINKELGI